MMKNNKKNIIPHSTHSAFSTSHSALSPQPFERGFTLVELAMVLVVIGLLIGLGASLIGPLMKQAKLKESRDVVRAAREAVVGYAMQYKMLPATIAAAGGRNTDAWGNSLTYITNMPDVSLCTTAPTYITTVTDNRTPITLTNLVVAIIFSKGDNGTDNTTVTLNSSYTINEQSSTYDDIVEYIDIAFLREKICNAFRITTDSLPIGTVEMAYPSSTTLAATDGTTPYTWSTGQAQGACAAGSVRLIASDIGICLNTTTGVISGTPTTDGSYSFIVQASDSESTPRTTTKSLTITINPNNPVITTEFLNYGTISVVYPTVTLSATGGKSPYTWSTGQAQGACAAGSVRLVASDIGICLNTTTGVISGTPTAAGTYSFAATVTDNAARQASKTLSVTINPY